MVQPTVEVPGRERAVRRQVHGGAPGVRPVTHQVLLTDRGPVSARPRTGGTAQDQATGNDHSSHTTNTGAGPAQEPDPAPLPARAGHAPERPGQLRAGIVGARSYDHGVPDAFTVLWTHDVCRALRRAGRTDRRPPVAFSGVHTSLPTWSGARAGDDVYAVHVDRGVVHVVSRMRITDLERGACCGTAPTNWDQPAFPGHGDWSMLGAGGCGAQAVHVEATPVRFDQPIPGDLLAQLTWRNRRGRTRQLKHVTDGRLEHSISLQGFYRLTPESADELAGITGDTTA
ncbi:hypothetical protein KNE206_54590 [Kitasatospora sp. NE20-6]